MSNSAYHPIGTGTEVPDALVTVERLLDFAGGRRFAEVELVVRTDSLAALRFLEPAAAGRRSVELHTTRTMVDALDPHLPDDHRRESDGLGVVDDGLGGVWLSLDSSDTAALAALAEMPAVPAEVTVDEVPLAMFDPAMIPAAGGPEAAMVEWRLERWPGIPGLDLLPDVKHAGIGLAVNSTGLWDLLPADPGYRLYVITRADADLGRHAELAAAAAGCTVIGPPEGY